MSAHLAIPATTFVLRRIIEQQMAKAYGSLTMPTVLTAPPPRPPVPAAGQAAPAESAGLVLYLHHAAVNGAWRNMLDPSVDDAGASMRHPPLVIDLHYMLAALGQGLEREALLGIGMIAMHRNPIVSRAKIGALLGAFQVPSPLTTIIDGIPGEKLANPASQPESLTITHQALDVDMSTKIWSALQVPIRPCAYYMVTTLFLTSDAPRPDGPLTSKVGVGVDIFDTRIPSPDGEPRKIESPLP